MAVECAIDSTDMLTQKMIKQAATKAKISVSDAELQKKAQDAVNRMGIKSIDQLLNQYRLTYYRFTAGIKVNALAEKTATSNQKVTDADSLGISRRDIS